MKQLSFLQSPKVMRWSIGAAAALTLANLAIARQTPYQLDSTLALNFDTREPAIPANDYLTQEELDDLLAPIALYPDVLLSAVLAASVYPDQVAAAAAMVASGATEAQIEATNWEDPVKAVANVPEVITMMGQYPDWTRAIGSAFLAQAWDVMDSIQRLRSIAFDNGVLETTPQQIVTVQQETQKIVIMPANPSVIFVPQYNPSVVFVRDNRAVARAGWIGFGTGVAVGAIIWGGSCNWNGGFIGWGRGWGWGGWGNTRVNNNININNNRNTNININRPGGRPDGRPGSGNQWSGGTGARPPVDRPGINRPGGPGGGAGADRPGSGRPDFSRPGADRPGTGGRPDINRPGTDRPGVNRPGGGNQSGINRPGGNQSGINRPGGNAGGSVGGINRPGTGDRIGQEGSRWQPNQNNRPGGGQGIGNRPSDWRNNANQPNARPPSSIGTGVGSNRPGGINRPTAPSNPGVNRPSTLPTQRPTTLPATRAPNVQPNRGGNAGAARPQPSRPQNPTTLPSAGAGTGNRPSGFSGGPGAAASNRGAASRGAGGGGGGGGNRPSRG